MTEPVSQKALRSVKWSVLMELVSRVSSPLIFIILARLLTPTDFGVLATAMIAISLAQAFCDASLAKALVQSKEPPENIAHVAFWTNVLVAVIAYAVLFLTAPSLSLFFQNPITEPVLRVAGFQIIIVSLSSVHQALLVREFRFRQLFWIKSLTAFVPGLISIPFAASGYGVWALVMGSLAGHLLNLWFFWHQSPWRPRMQFDLEAAKKLYPFGFWTAGEGLALWFFGWADNVMVGKFLGTASLGVYTVAWSISTILFGALVNPLLPVLYASFSRLQNDRIGLHAMFTNANRIIMALTLPLGTGLLLLGPDLALFFFGSHWPELGLVFGVLAFMMGMGWMVGINHELYRAIGHPDLNTKLMFIFILYYLPSFIIAAPFGLEVFVFTRLGVGLLAIPIHVYVSVRVLGLSPFYLWHNGRPVFLATLTMVFALCSLKWGFGLFMNEAPSLLIPGVMIFTSLVVYAGTLWLLDKPFVLHAKSLLRQAASS
jgi:O-antigen/teichoic acid export membrane protein